MGASVKMPFALVDGELSEPGRSGQRGMCLECYGETVAHCGEILQWHWAHLDLTECVGPSPMTMWHYEWQARFPTELREVVDGDHRADIKLPTGTVIEFQYSRLSPEQIREREAAYPALLWVLNAQEAFGAGRIDLVDELVGHPRHRRIWWHKMPPTLLQYRAPVLLDIGDDRVFDLRALPIRECEKWVRCDEEHWNDKKMKMQPCWWRIDAGAYGGFGYLRTVDELVDAAMGDWAPLPSPKRRCPKWKIQNDLKVKVTQ